VARDRSPCQKQSEFGGIQDRMSGDGLSGHFKPSERRQFNIGTWRSRNAVKLALPGKRHELRGQVDGDGKSITGHHERGARTTAAALRSATLRRVGPFSPARAAQACRRRRDAESRWPRSSRPPRSQRAAGRQVTPRKCARGTPASAGHDCLRLHPTIQSQIYGCPVWAELRGMR